MARKSTRQPIAGQAPAGTRLTSHPVRFLRNYLLGLWTAGELRLEEQEAGSYAAEVARFGETRTRDEDVVRLIRDDIAKAGGYADARFVRRRLKEFEQSALRAIGSRNAHVMYPAAA